MSIADFISKSDTIVLLNKQINMISTFYKRFYSRLYQEEIHDLKKEVSALHLKIKQEKAMKHHYMVKYKTISGTRSNASKVRVLLQDPDNKLTDKQIAAQCFLSVSRVKGIRYELKQEKNNG